MGEVADTIKIYQQVFDRLAPSLRMLPGAKYIGGGLGAMKAFGALAGIAASAFNGNISASTVPATRIEELLIEALRELGVPYSP